MENLNAEQIKKALECCSSSDSVSACESGCPYWGGDYDTCPCIEEPNFIIKNALALITSQEQRIKELTEENERLRENNLVFAHGVEKVAANYYNLGCTDTVKKMQERFAIHFGTYTDKDEVKVLEVFKLIDQIKKEIMEDTEND